MWSIFADKEVLSKKSTLTRKEIAKKYHVTDISDYALDLAAGLFDKEADY